MKFVLPCLLFLSFPACAEEASSFCDDTEAGAALCASGTAAPFLNCTEDAPCELLQGGDNGASRVEVVTPDDTPEGYHEQIYILE